MHRPRLLLELERKWRGRVQEEDDMKGVLKRSTGGHRGSRGAGLATMGYVLWFLLQHVLERRDVVVEISF